MTTKRTDPHRKGAIIPAEYEYVLSYNLPTTFNGWPVPAGGIDCEHEYPKGFPHLESKRCCVSGLRQIGKYFGNGCAGICSVCGAQYIYGDVWQHKPTGEFIHVGHECARKYAMLADRSAFELALGRRKQASAVEAQRAHNAEKRERFLFAHPGLAAALKVDHYILRDMAQRFTQYCSLSDKQVALALKIATEEQTPRPEEKHVAAPITDARQTVRGLVVSAKTHESVYGTTYKMTVKFTTPEGTWLAWGTVPEMLFDQLPTGPNGKLSELRGKTVEFTARFERGKEEHFAFFRRPTAASVVG